MKLRPEEKELQRLKVYEIKTRLIKQKAEFCDQDELSDDFEYLMNQIELEQSKELVERRLILLNDTVAICILRMYQKNEKFEISHRIDFLFTYVKDYMDQASSAMSNSLNAILKRFIEYIIKFEESHQLIIKNWIDVLIQVPSKSNFRILELLFKYVNDKSYVFSKHPDFVQNSLMLMDNKSLATPISKLIIILYQDSSDDLSWKTILDSWSQPRLKQPITNLLLPGLFRISPSSLTSIIADTNSDMELLMTLLKIGQNLQLFDKPYREIDKSIFKALLVHQDPNYRIDALTLLFGSTEKNAKSYPIEQDVYTMFQEYHILDIFLNEYDNIEIRNKFISIMQNFLNNRFKDSLNKKGLSNDLLLSGHAFLSLLLSRLILYLVPSSNYSQISASMELIYIILTGQDYEIIKGVSNKLPYHLFQNLFNDYESIRQWSYKILKVYPNLIVSDAIAKDLIRQSDIALQDLSGRKSEGGAKAIEFLTFYYNNQPDRAQELVDSLVVKVKNGLENEGNVHGYFKVLSLVPGKYLMKHRSLLLELICTAWDQNKLLLTSEELFEDKKFDEDEEKSNHAWKVVKESNLLLLSLLKRCEVPDEYFLKSCELIMEQIASVKHRGVVLSIYTSFLEVCQTCFETVSRSQYPEIWLKQNLDLITSRTQFISRRSGGIPYLITGILLALKGTRLDLQKYTFEKLIVTAQEPYEYLADQRNDIPQVHAFNCLKQLFLESSLSQESLNYAQVSLELSLKYFNAENWSIRNCAVMLFGSIQQRILGNSTQYPSRLFFMKFKGLDETFTRLLNQELECGTNNNPIVFPISIMISKLACSDNDETLKELKPILMHYLNDKDYKVREVVGRCLSNLLTSKELLELVHVLFDGQVKNNNYAHGCLITVLESLETFKNGDMETLNLFLDNIQIYSKSDVLFNYYIKIIHTLATRNKLGIDPNIINFLGNTIISKVDENGGDVQLTLCSIIEFLIDQYLMNDDETNAIDLINLSLSLNFKVQTFVLELFENLPQRLQKECHEAIWRIIENMDTWSYVKALALDVYNDIIPSIQITEKSTKASTLYDLIDNGNQNVSLGALKCIGAFSYKEEEIARRCLENCEDGQPFENRDAAITCLLHMAVSAKDNTLAKFIIYTYGLADEDESIRTMAGEFFVRSFYEQPTNTTYIQYDGPERFGELVNTESGRAALQLIIERQLTPLPGKLTQTESNGELKLSSLYGIERQNLYKNEEILAQCLTQFYHHADAGEISSELNTNLISITNQVKLMEVDDIELVSWRRDEFTYVPIMKALIIGDLFKDGLQLEQSIQSKVDSGKPVNSNSIL